MKVVIIGAGAVVDSHYQTPLKRLEKAGALRVMAVADVDESRGTRIAKRFRHARAFTDVEVAFDEMSYDIAVIASPASLHAHHAIKAFEHGCHVLCEKPMSTTPAEATRMNSASTRADRALCIAFPRRFWPSLADVASLVAQGELGDDMRFSYRDGQTYHWPITTAAAFQREQSRGGALLDMGVHLLDALTWIFGDDVEVEKAFDDGWAPGVDTNARLELVFPRARGAMQVSWEYPLNNGLRIQGSRGELVLGNELSVYRRRTAASWIQVPATTDWPSDTKQAGGERLRPRTAQEVFQVQLIAMLRCIAYEERFPVDGIRAAGLQATIEESYRKSEPLDPIWLSETERRAARARHWNQDHRG